MLIKKEITDYPKGTLENLLVSSYGEFHKVWPKAEGENLVKFHQCDTFFYDNLRIGLKCSFITEYENKICGMCCWDPRGLPNAVIGHNCILPDYRRRGLGKLQLGMALKILKNGGFETAEVSTGLSDFFLPTRKMYTANGFIESRRDKIDVSEDKFNAKIYYKLCFSSVLK